MKRLYLEVHHRDLALISAETQAAFSKGHVVGDLAHKIYGNPQASFIPYKGGLKHALTKSTRLLKQEQRAPIFEATVQYRGVLIRADVMLPDGNGWRLIEVKASTSVKPDHSFDCAVQAWVLRRSGYELKSVSLAHVDNRFVYNGDGNFDGLLLEDSLDDDVDALIPSVAEWASQARDALAGDEPDIAVGGHCFAPYECPFVNHCWPGDSDFPLLGLGGKATKEFIGELVAAGYTDVRDIPGERLNDTQLRVQRVSLNGEPELLPAAAEFAGSLAYPRYYLDFETVSPAVPLWKDTRPYEVVPFQWSCHYEERAGEIAHAEFLDLTGDDPIRRFAESLIRAVGGNGPILVYSGYEAWVIRKLMQRLPALQDALQAIIDRLEDLLPVTRDNYYHPDMHGSWSIKAVLPTLSDLDYGGLGGVSDGTAASEAYLEAIGANTGDDRKAELRQQLLDYCRFDTQALVKLVSFFAHAK